MEINNLFGSTADKAPNQNESIQSTVRNVSYSNTLNAKPLIYGLEKGLVQHDFNLQMDAPSACAERLLQGEVEMALIPSIEYAKSKGSWKIVPDVCIASNGAVKNVALYFNRDIRNMRRVAVDSKARTSVVLLKILLQEKYELEPEFISMEANLKEMLKQADAALIVGDEALDEQIRSPYYLDLGEEWTDLTGLPFVYSFWAGHEMSITDKEVRAMKQSYEAGKQNLDSICKEYAVGHSQDWEFYKDYLTNHIQYTFGTEEKEGLTEFFHYAFYFGLIEHIPDLHFYEDA